MRTTQELIYQLQANLQHVCMDETYIIVYLLSLKCHYHEWSPLHLILLSFRSESHSPFPIHVDVFGPVSICPMGELKLIIAPSNDGLT